MPSWRLYVLCEDRWQERFVRQLLERYDIACLQVEIAPAGKGAGSAWVRKTYPGLAKRLRSKNFQKSLGLLVVIDGDNLGFHKRKRELDEERRSQGLAVRSSTEPVAIFVPTWSIETWLAELCGRGPVAESEPVKDDPGLRELWDRREAETLRAAADAWRSSATSVLSLNDAYQEASRFGM